MDRRIGLCLFKDEDEILLAKAWVTSPVDVAMAFFYYDSRLIKNQNVTLVLSLIRLGDDVRIGTRVLDKNNGNAVLFERSVTDTPLADPVVPNARVFPACWTLRGPPGRSPAPLETLTRHGLGGFATFFSRSRAGHLR